MKILATADSHFGYEYGRTAAAKSDSVRRMNQAFEHVLDAAYQVWTATAAGERWLSPRHAGAAWRWVVRATWRGLRSGRATVTWPLERQPGPRPAVLSHVDPQGEGGDEQHTYDDDRACGNQ